MKSIVNDLKIAQSAIDGDSSLYDVVGKAITLVQAIEAVYGIGYVEEQTEELHECEECKNKVKETFTCRVCKREICFECFYSTSETCPECYNKEHRLGDIKDQTERIVLKLSDKMVEIPIDKMPESQTEEKEPDYIKLTGKFVEYDIKEDKIRHQCEKCKAVTDELVVCTDCGKYLCIDCNYETEGDELCLECNQERTGYKTVLVTVRTDFIQIKVDGRLDTSYVVKEGMNQIIEFANKLKELSAKGYKIKFNQKEGD